jgi:hypothetical protein
MVAIDTNLLIYAHRAKSEFNRAAQRAVEAASVNRDGWGIPYPCLAEFWNAVTLPKAVERPSSPREAAAFLEALLDADARIFYPAAGCWDRLLRIAIAKGLRGRRIYDLQIGLIALDAGATEIWTHDRNFLAVDGLTVRDPLQPPRT